MIRQWEAMPTETTFSSSALVRRSRTVREQARSQQQKSLPLTTVAPLGARDKSSELCRQSDELLRRSRELCDRLRKICHAR
jgi:hypothetical protein